MSGYKNFEDLIEKASSNDAQAQFDLAIKFIDGDGVDADRDMAMQLLEASAIQGHGDAQAELADLLCTYGWVNSSDEEKVILMAKKWATLSVNQDNPNGKISLAKILMISGDGQEDSKAMLHLLRSAVAQGSAEAEYLLSGFSRGIHSRRLMESSASKGYLPAIASEGIRLFQMGKKIISKDPRSKEAKHHFMEALSRFEVVVKGGRGSMVDSVLSEMYEHGWGLKKNPQKAANLIMRGANAGFPAYQKRLGDMYAKGFGVPKDEDKAIQLWNAAARFDASLKSGSKRGPSI